MKNIEKVESDIYEVSIDIQPEHFVSPLIEDGNISTEIGIEEEIAILQDMDQQELSRMIPGIHKQGLDYDGLKDSVVERAKQEIEIPKMDDELMLELTSFFKDLDSKIIQISGVADQYLSEGKPMTAQAGMEILKGNNNESAS